MKALRFTFTMIILTCVASIGNAGTEHSVASKLSPSSLSKQDMLNELTWFQSASKPFKGKSIRVVSEDIPTHQMGARCTGSFI